MKDKMDYRKGRMIAPWVLVEMDEPTSITPGGLKLPDGSEIIKHWYTILSLPVTRAGEPSDFTWDFSVDDRFTCQPHQVQFLPELGELVGFINAQDIVMVFPKEKTDAPEKTES